jgi:hypothetical protein
MNTKAGTRLGGAGAAMLTAWLCLALCAMAPAMEAEPKPDSMPESAVESPLVFLLEILFVEQEDPDTTGTDMGTVGMKSGKAAAIRLDDLVTSARKTTIIPLSLVISGPGVYETNNFDTTTTASGAGDASSNTQSDIGQSVKAIVETIRPTGLNVSLDINSVALPGGKNSVPGGKFLSHCSTHMRMSIEDKWICPGGWNQWARAGSKAVAGWFLLRLSRLDTGHPIP